MEGEQVESCNEIETYLTRGEYPEGYTSRIWTIVVKLDFGMDYEQDVGLDCGHK